MLQKKALRISLRGVDGRMSMESRHTSIGRITPIPTLRVLVLPEDEIIDDGANCNAQHHDEEEHVTTDDDEDDNEDPAHPEPETHSDDVLSMLNDNYNKEMMAQNRMLLKLLFEQQAEWEEEHTRILAELAPVGLPNGTRIPSQLNRKFSRWSTLCSTLEERRSEISFSSLYTRTSILTNAFSRKEAQIESSMRSPSSTPGITTLMQVND